MHHMLPKINENVFDQLRTVEQQCPGKIPHDLYDDDGQQNDTKNQSLPVRAPPKVLCLNYANTLVVVKNAIVGEAAMIA